MAKTTIKGNQIDLAKATAYADLFDGQPRWDGTNLVVNQGGVDVIIGPNTAALNGTFQWDATRTTGISNAGLTTVTFGGTFTEYPVVVAVAEKGDAATNVLTIQDVTKTNFKVKSNSVSAHAVHWFACTAGVWLVNSNIIYAGHGSTGGEGGNINRRVSRVDFSRPFPRTPAVMSAYIALPDDNTVPNSYHTAYYDFPNALGDLDAAVFGTVLEQNAAGTVARGVGYVAIQSSGAAQNGGGAFTSAGASTLKAAVPFESGFARKSVAGTGPFTATFSAAFAAAPVVILGGANADVQETSSIVTVNVTPLTTSFDFNNSGGTGVGMGWMAIKSGFDSTTARRLI